MLPPPHPRPPLVSVSIEQKNPRQPSVTRTEGTQGRWLRLLGGLWARKESRVGQKSRSVLMKFWQEKLRGSYGWSKLGIYAGRGGRKVNSLATRSWIFQPGNSHQWFLGLHGQTTRKNMQRCQYFPSPLKSPPSTP